MKSTKGNRRTTHALFARPWVSLVFPSGTFHCQKLANGGTSPKLLNFPILSRVIEGLRLLQTGKFDEDETACLRFPFKSHNVSTANDEFATKPGDHFRRSFGILPVFRPIGHLNSGNNISWHADESVARFCQQETLACD